MFVDSFGDCTACFASIGMYLCHIWFKTRRWTQQRTIGIQPNSSPCKNARRTTFAMFSRIPRRHYQDVRFWKDENVIKNETTFH